MQLRVSMHNFHVTFQMYFFWQILLYKCHIDNFFLFSYLLNFTFYFSTSLMKIPRSASIWVVQNPNCKLNGTNWIFALKTSKYFFSSCYTLLRNHVNAKQIHCNPCVKMLQALRVHI